MIASAPLVEAGDMRIPAIGLGTWALRGEACAKSVAAALQIGYRHIDTATMYDNEAEVGRALRASGVSPEDCFVTTKVWPSDISAAALPRSVEASLKRLQLSAVDLLLIHWPNPSISLAESIGALCAAKRRGLARHIGVSNFSVDLLRQAAALASEPILANQCECHPRLDQTALIEACREVGAVFVSHRPLSKGALADDRLLKRIGLAHNKSAAQVALRWHIQRGLVPIPKAARREHLAENIAIFDFRLSEAEMSEITALGRG